MLIKNGGTIMDGILGPRRIPARLRGVSAALMLGGSILLSGPRLPAQDWLLKEYIYLDGRLLAVERNVVLLAARQPEDDGAREGNDAFALHTPSRIAGPVRPGNNWRIEAPDFLGSSSAGSFQNRNLAASSNPGEERNPLYAVEAPELLREQSRRAWIVPGTNALKEVGNDGCN